MPRPRGRPRKNDTTNTRSKVPASAGRPRGRPRKDNSSSASFKPVEKKGTIDIYWIGHSSFRIHSVTHGKSIITDPYVIPKKRTNIISAFTVSHFDEHHNHIPDHASNIRVFQSPGEYEYDGFTIRAVMSPLSPKINRDARNVVYSICIDGFNICHMGNINEPLTAQHIDMLGPVDVMLAPHDNDNNNLLSYYEILKLARQLDVKIIVPMHYSKDQLPATFINDSGISRNKIDQKNKLRLSNNTIPSNLNIEFLEPQIDESQLRLGSRKKQTINNKKDLLLDYKNQNKHRLQSMFRF